MTLKEFVNYFDFDLVIGLDENNSVCMRLVDRQGANLGDIESEVFYNTDDIVERLDAYYGDYIFNDAEDQGYEGVHEWQALLDFEKEQDKSLYDDHIKLIEHIYCGESFDGVI